MPSIAEYQQRLQSIYEDMFVSGLENWKDGDNGDSIAIANWMDSVKGGTFIDYDGHGNFAFKRADGVYVVQKADGQTVRHNSLGYYAAIMGVSRYLV